ncbi:MAG: formyltransferase family protein, partial [Pirellula sp.]
LEHLLIPDDFENRVINIHPSLIPAFCGKGMYGLYVHQAAIEFGVKVSGCTVHFVDNQYDHGPILLQRTCEVLDDDTPETLQKRVFELERKALPDAINKIAQAL